MKGILTKRNLAIGGAAGGGLWLFNFITRIDTPGEVIGVLLVTVGCVALPAGMFMLGWWLRGRRFMAGQL